MTKEGSPDSTAVFAKDGNRYMPTEAARGPWNPDALHGAAVAALLAGVFESSGEVVVRVLVELLGPVPYESLRIEVAGSEGGRRVRRQSAVLYARDRPVATASATRIRRADLLLPAEAMAHRVVFDPAQVPDLDQPNRHAAAVVGWPSFDSLAVATARQPTAEGGSLNLWIRLLLPIVGGQATTGTQRAVAAADYGSGGTSARLPFKAWSFMNADLTVSLSRPPQGEWIGMACEGIVQSTGTGLSVGSLYDIDGRLGQSTQSLVLEARSPS
jgi:hypothetical protein